LPDKSREAYVSRQPCHVGHRLVIPTLQHIEHRRCESHSEIHRKAVRSSAVNSQHRDKGYIGLQMTPTALSPEPFSPAPTDTGSSFSSNLFHPSSRFRYMVVAERIQASRYTQDMSWRRARRTGRQSPPRAGGTRSALRRNSQTGHRRERAQSHPSRAESPGSPHPTPSATPGKSRHVRAVTWRLGAHISGRTT